MMRKPGLDAPAVLMLVLAASAVVYLAGGCSADRADAKARVPCSAHVGPARKACRARLAWPPRPSEAEIISRIGRAQWHKAIRVAYCETGGNWRHYPHGSYIGGLGMFRSTYGIGQAVTGYRWPAEGATRAEQIAVAIIVQRRYGWSAWGCGGA